MPKVKNEELAGLRFGALDQVITLDAAGEADVPADVAAHLEQIPGFTILPTDEPVKAVAKKTPAKKSVLADKE